MKTQFIWFCAFISTGNGSWLLKEDRACDPGNRNFVFPYTGFRLHRQYTFGLPVLHHNRLSHCENGVVDMESALPTDRNSDIAWGADFCVSDTVCYRAVRRKKYALRLMSLYVPHTLVGGLFQCPARERCTNENARPILPLLADSISQQWIELHRLRQVVQRVPYLYTPNFIDPRYPHRPEKEYEWSRVLDVNEEYVYSDRELRRLSHALTRTMNRLHSVLSLHGLPWEQDMLLADLDRDFRTSSKSMDMLWYLLPVFARLSPDAVESIVVFLQAPLDHANISEHTN
ncbi:hypothetical protein TRVA0_027S01332 [Trichomonascus vanleenenianus]|uniref:uncharacterized protein n=1 Tax=Trichomonascus vanleenenianus TaxID=2268995 RepID=UPI003EC982C2